MGSMRGLNGQGDAPRRRACVGELVERLARIIPEDGSVEALEGLHLYRASSPTGMVHGVHEPSFCVVAQGGKEVFLGERRYRYDPSRYLLASVDLPISSQVVEALDREPYLGLRLVLDPPLVTSVMLEAGIARPENDSEVEALDVSPLDTDLLDAVLRLVRLADSPANAKVLGPLVVREIVYRLMVGEQGGRLCHIAVLEGRAHRIAKAVELLRANFNQPLRMDDVAAELGMSVSGFYHHFKAITALSPLQFQKRLRLQEARRLMLSQAFDAADAGYEVGYEDASHFSRDYKRLFGEPPMRDVERLRSVGDT